MASDLEGAGGVGDERVVGRVATGEGEEGLLSDEGGGGERPGKSLALEGTESRSEETTATDRFAGVLEDVEF